MIGTKEEFDIFEEIHKTGKWLKKDPERETSCGVGSKINNNKILIEKIPEIIETYGIKQVIDVGCGDLNWIRLLFDYFIQNKIYYTGLDVSETIIEKTTSKINHTIEFIDLKIGTIEDIESEIIPSKTLILSKDVLVHLPNEIILDTMKEFRKKANYLLTTNFPRKGTNKNIHFGEWRPINLEKKPFNLYGKITSIKNQDLGTKYIFPDKEMALFRI